MQPCHLVLFEGKNSLDRRANRYKYRCSCAKQAVISMGVAHLLRYMYFPNAAKRFDEIGKEIAF